MIEYCQIELTRGQIVRVSPEDFEAHSWRTRLIAALRIYITENSQERPKGSDTWQQGRKAVINRLGDYMQRLRFLFRALTHRIAFDNCGDDYARAVCSCGWSKQGYRESRWDDVFSGSYRHLRG